MWHREIWYTVMDISEGQVLCILCSGREAPLHEIRKINTKELMDVFLTHTHAEKKL